MAMLLAKARGRPRNRQIGGKPEEQEGCQSGGWARTTARCGVMVLCVSRTLFACVGYANMASCPSRDVKTDSREAQPGRGLSATTRCSPPAYAGANCAGRNLRNPDAPPWWRWGDPPKDRTMDSGPLRRLAKIT